MSWGLDGHFYINGKEVFTAGLDRLKSISDRSNDLDNVDAIPKPDNIEASDDLVFYNYDSFSKALPIYKKEYKKISKKLKYIKSLEKSIEYFTLTGDQKEALFDEGADYKEVKEDCKYKVFAIKYILNIFLLLEDIEFDDEDYHNQKNICVGIEVS